MEHIILGDIAIILGLSILVLFVSSKAGIPTILSYLATGMVAGPYGLKLIHAVKEVEQIAEIGVILLLFSIGIEFSFSKLARIKKTVMIGGGLQVLLTIFGTYAVVQVLGDNHAQAIFAGFLMALSSTAIVLKILQERGEMETPQGQATLALLIFQDIAIVPLMLLTPILGGQSTDLTTTLMVLALKAGAIILIVIVAARYLVPGLLHQIALTRSRELFLLTTCALGLAVAWGANWAGLSMGLGAFMAGLIISESEYSHHALSSILPFRDVFASFFFVSIGMLLDLSFVLENFTLVVAASLFLVIFKAILGFAACEILGLPLKTSAMVAMNISQIGEFSFILAKLGLGMALISEDHYQLFLAISIVSLGLTPVMVWLSHPASNQLSKLPLGPLAKGGFANRHILKGNQKQTKLKDHLVIFGYGVTGEMLCKAAQYANTRYAILELNPHTVRRKRLEGEPIFFGDATHEESLHLVGIEHARIAVITTPDVHATAIIIQNARRLNPKLYIIARTRYINQIESLYSAGADEVIPLEYETAVEIFGRVMHRFLIPHEEIEKLIAEIRAGGYQMFRSVNRPKQAGLDLNDYLRDLDIRVFRVQRGSLLIGKTMMEANLWREFGVNVLAIQRGGETMANPKASLSFEAEDIVIIMGQGEHITFVAPLFKNANELAL